MRNVPTIAPLVVLCALLAVAQAARAVWTPDGVPLCNAAGDQATPQLISDDVGGAIVVWQDQRSGVWDIYAMKVGPDGVRFWNVDGLDVCTAAGQQTMPQLAPDGSHGAIIVWEDDRNGGSANHDIYVQRVHAGGWVEWAEPGVAVCTASGNQQFPCIASDMEGGAVMTWMDSRSGIYDVYVQRVNAAGVAQWANDGVSVCATSRIRMYPMIVTDGAGGAIVAWLDATSSTYRYFAAQRFDAAGARLWSTSGVFLVTTDSWKESMDLCADGAGGAIATWMDRRSGNYDIYAQRIDASGAIQWSAAGAPVCVAGPAQSEPRIAPAGVGGAIVVWSDERGGTGAEDIYAQRLGPAGGILWSWAPAGLVVSSPPDRQHGPALAADGAGGAVITWTSDYAESYDIYTQWVDCNGTNRWEVDGAPLCSAAGRQQNANVIFSSEDCAIAAWSDLRNGSGNLDIYAQETELVDVVGSPSIRSALLRLQSHPNPFNPVATIGFEVPFDGPAVLRIYDIQGRQLRTLLDSYRTRGSHRMSWDGCDTSGRAMASGSYFARLDACGACAMVRMSLVR